MSVNAVKTVTLELIFLALTLCLFLVTDYTLEQVGTCALYLHQCLSPHLCVVCPLFICLEFRKICLKSPPGGRVAGGVLDGRVLAAGGQLRLGQQVVGQREPRLIGDAGRMGSVAGQAGIVGAGVDEPVLSAASQAGGMPLSGRELGRVHVAAQQQDAAGVDAGDDARDGAGGGVAGAIEMVGV